MKPRVLFVCSLLATTSAILLQTFFCADSAATQPSSNKEPTVTFKQHVLPFLSKNCFACHGNGKKKGGVTLDKFTDDQAIEKDRALWQAAYDMIRTGEMPPKGQPKPAKADTEGAMKAIDHLLTHVDCTGPRNVGRVTIRRLNRAEYNNTIRDLCGVDFKPAEEFPSDDVGYGFDNIGDVLSFQPVLLEKYMAAAGRILDAALKIEEPAKSSKQSFAAQNIIVIPRSAKSPDPVKIVFKSEGSGMLEKHNFPAEGEYTLRFRGWGTDDGGEYPNVVIRVDGKDVKAFRVEAAQGKAQTYEVSAKFTPGEKRVVVAFTNAFEDKVEKKLREFGLERIEIEGPFKAVPPPELASVKLLLIVRPKTTSEARAAAEKVLTNFARRAYRRPVKADELQRLMKLFDLASKQGEEFEKAIKLPMKAVLVSPHFLYRIEDDPKNPNDVRTINDFEFATRLSYFLWSTMPDEELFKLAEKGDIRKPGVLESQIKRMLKKKASGPCRRTAGQWLEPERRALTPARVSRIGTVAGAAMVRGEAHFDMSSRMTAHPVLTQTFFLTTAITAS